nr:TetR/AcrR family transcriptional regulator [Rhodococcus opacus]
MDTAGTEDRTYGGRPVAARKAERRSRFLEAALTVFAEKGYAKSSVADICAAADLARGQFYDEFRSREDLLLAVYDQVQSDAREAMVAALAKETGTDPRTLAAVAMAAFVESIGRDPRRTKISFVDIVGVSPRVEQHRIDQRGVWVSFFESTVGGAMGADFVPPGGYDMASTAFIGALVALVQQWSTADPRPPVEGLIELMTRLLSALIPD